MKNNEKYLFYMAKKGDILAYEKLIEGYERKVFSLILSAVGDRTQASELTQDIFVKVYKDLWQEETDNRLSHMVYGTTRKALLSWCTNNKCDGMKGNGLNISLT